MDRDQARDLWIATLGCREVPEGEAGRVALRPLWAAAVLTEAQRAALGPALDEPLATERRAAVVRATRRVIAADGWPVDLLTTPAAAMRGL